MVKRLTMLALLLTLSIGVLAQPVTSFPAMKGVVSDYAGRLDEAQISELSGLLKDYERHTSIEFVVVVVNSLDGLSARNYATGIGDFWKIGKAGRDNGIVLLWAPNERAYALRVAEGLSADLTSSDATQITRQNLLPNFKRGEYYAGLKETVLATMKHLGATTWEARLKARQSDPEQETLDRKRRAQEAWQAEVQRREAEARQAEQERKLQSDTRTGFVFVSVLVLGTLLAFVILRMRRRKAKFAELAQSVTTIADNLSAAEKNAPEIQGILDDCAREMPEQDISKLREGLAGQQERILKIKVDGQCIDPAKLESYDDMVRVRSNSETERNLLESTKESIAGMRQAKAQSQAMMEKLSRETFEITDVRDISRTNEVNRLLLQSRQDYEQARQGSSMSLVDWLIINQMLSNSQNRMRQAVSCSQEAPYAPSFSSLDDSSSSRRSSSSSWFDSSSSSSSSGGFFSGGDSGGDSGGGGGSFSSGSGSDGSY
ncbi:MAG TPA: TPM domain-containing protein [Candidatus Angelobacter sp.]|nr:TPM domain-containing protein [Candidatus Angelobacter sp.]